MNVYGLIGYPLDHSFSKKYFTEKFEKENLAGCSFILYPLKEITAFPKLIEDEKSLNGLAVTIPYKEAVISYLNYLDDEAIQVGAVNCIKISGNILTGYNTDIVGFEKSFVPLLQSHHKKALVLGSGGASKAVQFVLKKLGIDFLVISRREKKEHGFLNYGNMDQALIQEYPVIINCTPMGMSPNDHEYPLIPYQFLGNRNFLYDLIYSPAQTIFLKEGLKKAAVVKNGYEMLVIQAEENWRIWNDL